MELPIWVDGASNLPIVDNFFGCDGCAAAAAVSRSAGALFVKKNVVHMFVDGALRRNDLIIVSWHCVYIEFMWHCVRVLVKLCGVNFRMFTI